jgi:hypothetical protein
VIDILQSFGGYTYSSLMEEDAELLQMLAIVARARKEDGPDEQ